MRRTRIHREVAAVEHRLLALLLQAVALRRPDAGQQFVEAERLGDVVVGAVVERLHLGGLVAAAGQHDDRDRGAGGADALDRLQAIDVGQAEIQHDQVGAAAAGVVDGGMAVAGLGHHVALRGQASAQEPADRRLVVDDEDAQGAGAEGHWGRSGDGRRLATPHPGPPPNGGGRRAGGVAGGTRHD